MMISFINAGSGWKDVNRKRPSGPKVVAKAGLQSSLEEAVSKMSADELEDYCSCPITQARLMCPVDLGCAFKHLSLLNLLCVDLCPINLLDLWQALVGYLACSEGSMRILTKILSM